MQHYTSPVVAELCFASCTYRGAYLCPLDSLILDAATPGCSYLWENMDTIPTQKIYEPCSKTVTLTDQHKCVNSKTVQIHPDESLECEPGIYVPSSFTPNGDGYNETFFPIFRDDVLDIYEFSIYNTWGEFIFNSNTPGEAWNGTVRGQLCQTGVYTWKLNYSFSYSSVKKEMYGLVLLFQ